MLHSMLLFLLMDRDNRHSHKCTGVVGKKELKMSMGPFTKLYDQMITHSKYSCIVYCIYNISYILIYKSVIVYDRYILYSIVFFARRIRSLCLNLYILTI